MLGLFLVAALVAAEPAKAEKPLPTVDKINAVLGAGIIKPSPHSPSKGATSKKPNRIYTVAELTARFGEADRRESSSTKAGAEKWGWKCSDGWAVATFEPMGYGHAGDAKTQRLQILRIEIHRTAAGEEVPDYPVGMLRGPKKTKTAP